MAIDHKKSDAYFGKKIIHERIKEARIYRGLSQKELAESVGVTKQSVSNYENKLNDPNVEVLLKISRSLKFPVNFFYKIRKNCESPGEVYFRSSAIPAKKKEMLKQKFDFLSNDVLSLLENYIRLPELDLIEVPYKDQYSRDDIVEIVKNLREYWGLLNKPISNLTHTMQEHGCIVAMLSLGETRTDGYSAWYGNRPITFINAEKNAAVRARFTLAHELGHIILHRNLKIGEDLKKREKEAHFFAGELLFPSEVAIDEILYISLDNFIPIKEKWGISIGAIVRRCMDLHLITDDRYTMLQKQISKKKWRTVEPLDDVMKIETPKLFKEAINILEDNHILNKKDFLEYAAFDEEELISLCCLPNDFFSEPLLDIIPKTKLTIVK